MHVSIPYHASVEGVLRGHRTPKTVYILRRAEIAFDEYQDLPLALTIRTRRSPAQVLATRERGGHNEPLGPVKETEYRLLPNGKLVYRFIPVAEAQRRTEQHRLSRILNGYQHVPSDSQFSEMPPMRQVIRDNDSEAVAKLEKVASGMPVYDGSIWAPIDEPFFRVVTTGKRERFYLLRLEIANGPNGTENSFRLDQMEEAIAFARDHGAMDEEIQEFRECVQVSIHRPEILNFKNHDAGLVRALFNLVENFRTKVTSKPIDTAMAWFQLRDILESWKAGRISQIEVLAEAIRGPFDVLRADPDADEMVISSIGRLLPAFAPAEDPEDQEALTGFGPSF